MKNTVIVLCLLLCLTACKEKKLEKRKAKGFTQGAGHMQNTIEFALSAKERIAEARANQASKMFQAQHGRNPTDLDELMNFVNPELPRLPRGMGYFYESDTGKVTVEAEE